MLIEIHDTGIGLSPRTSRRSTSGSPRRPPWTSPSPAAWVCSWSAVCRSATASGSSSARPTPAARPRWSCCPWMSPRAARSRRASPGSRAAPAVRPPRRPPRAPPPRGAPPGPASPAAARSARVCPAGASVPVRARGPRCPGGTAQAVPAAGDRRVPRATRLPRCSTRALPPLPRRAVPLRRVPASGSSRARTRRRPGTRARTASAAAGARCRRSGATPRARPQSPAPAARRRPSGTAGRRPAAAHAELERRQRPAAGPAPLDGRPARPRGAGRLPHRRDAALRRPSGSRRHGGDPRFDEQQHTPGQDTGQYGRPGANGAPSTGQFVRGDIFGAQQGGRPGAQNPASTGQFPPPQGYDTGTGQYPAPGQNDGSTGQYALPGRAGSGDPSGTGQFERPRVNGTHGGGPVPPRPQPPQQQEQRQPSDQWALPRPPARATAVRRCTTRWRPTGSAARAVRRSRATAPRRPPRSSSRSSSPPTAEPHRLAAVQRRLAQLAPDELVKQAERVRKPAAGGVTTSGLPRRVPKANLVPGTAQQQSHQSGPQVSRAPDDVRGRLTNLRRGIAQGRQAGSAQTGSFPHPTHQQER